MAADSEEEAAVNNSGLASGPPGRKNLTISHILQAISEITLRYADSRVVMLHIFVAMIMVTTDSAAKKLAFRVASFLHLLVRVLVLVVAVKWRSALNELVRSRQRQPLR
jgi:hypothetical protein